MDFEHDGLRYNIVPATDGKRLRLWFNQGKGSGWEFGHAKNVPSDMTLADAAQAMRDFVEGTTEHCRYNEILPAA